MLIFTVLCRAFSDPISSCDMRTREMFILVVTLDRAPPRKNCSSMTRCLWLGRVVSSGCSALWHLMRVNVLLLAFRALTSVGVLDLLLLFLLLSESVSQDRVVLRFLRILLLSSVSVVVSLWMAGEWLRLRDSLVAVWATVTCSLRRWCGMCMDYFPLWKRCPTLLRTAGAVHAENLMFWFGLKWLMVPTSLTAFIRMRLLRGLLWLWNWCVRRRMRGRRTAISLLCMFVCVGLRLLSIVKWVRSLRLCVWLLCDYLEELPMMLLKRLYGCVGGRLIGCCVFWLLFGLLGWLVLLR